MTSILTPQQLSAAKQICSYLSPPFPSNSAFAFCGNMAQESSLDPKALNSAEGSYGLIQWLGNRLANLKTWCSANNLDYTSAEGQCKFIIYELPTGDGAPNIVPWLYDMSNGGQPQRSIATLTADISQFYERPGNPQLENRIAYANQVAQFMLSPPPAPPPTPTANNNALIISLAQAIIKLCGG